MGKRTESFISAETFQDFLDLYGNSQLQLALSTTEAATSALSPGFYDVWIDAVRAYIKIGDDVTGVTTNNGYPIFAGNVVTCYIRANHKIGAILASGTGTLRYHKVDG